MEIVDTVYLIAYLRPSDPLHPDSIGVIEELGDDRRVSQASLLELDLLMKSRGFAIDQRIKVWHLLNGVVDGFVEPLSPLDIALGAFLSSKGLDYFDSLIAAQCLIRGAKPVTTDLEIIELIERGGELLGEFDELSY